MGPRVKRGWIIAILAALVIGGLLILFRPSAPQEEAAVPSATPPSQETVAPDNFTPTQSAPSAPGEMLDTQSIASTVITVFFTLPGTAEQSDQIRPLVTEKFMGEYESLHADPSLGITSVVTEVAFPEQQPGQRENRMIIHEAAVTIHTKYLSGRQETITNTALVTFVLDKGWRVDSIKELAGRPGEEKEE
jgi:hypothetical protein